MSITTDIHNAKNAAGTIMNYYEPLGTVSESELVPAKWLVFLAVAAFNLADSCESLLLRMDELEKQLRQKAGSEHGS